MIEAEMYGMMPSANTVMRLMAPPANMSTMPSTPPECCEKIAAKAAESEKTIAGIRDGAAAAVAEVARDVAAELVGALGGGADAKTVTAAVTARLKG